MKYFNHSIALFLALFSSSCAYHLQGTENPLKDKEGVSRIFIEHIKNDTFKPGIETVVYNSLVKEIAVHKRVRIVSTPDRADAILSGSVVSAEFKSNSTSSVKDLPQPPGVTIPEDILLSATYLARLTCAFKLNKIPKPGAPPPPQITIWQSSFSREKTFAGNNQLGILGNTSALINESEFDRALNDLSDDMVSDVHESMLAIF